MTKHLWNKKEIWKLFPHLKQKNQIPKAEPVLGWKWITGLPVLSGPERVQFARAAHGDDQQKSADEAAHRCRGDDLPGQHDGAVELVRAVLTVHLAVAAPALKHTPAGGTKGRVLPKRNSSTDLFAARLNRKRWRDAERTISTHYVRGCNYMTDVNSQFKTLIQRVKRKSWQKVQL